MDLRGELSILDKSPQKEFMCEHCGTRVPSYNKELGICQFCELPATKTEDELKGDTTTYPLLKMISESVSKGSWEDLAKPLDQLVTLKNTPQAFYCAAVFYSTISDFEMGRLDYANLHGFMEENASRIDQSNLLFSKSKSLLYQSIALYKKTQGSTTDRELLYTNFLCELRLERLVDAKNTLTLLNTVNRDDILTDYATMLYSYRANEHKSFENSVVKLVADGIAPTFYYSANYLSDQKKFNDAKLILNKLLNRIDMYNAKKLLGGIERATRIQ